MQRRCGEMGRGWTACDPGLAEDEEGERSGERHVISRPGGLGSEGYGVAILPPPGHWGRPRTCGTGPVAEGRERATEAFTMGMVGGHRRRRRWDEDEERCDDEGAPVGMEEGLMCPGEGEVEVVRRTCCWMGAHWRVSMYLHVLPSTSWTQDHLGDCRARHRPTKSDARCFLNRTSGGRTRHVAGLPEEAGPCALGAGVRRAKPDRAYAAHVGGQTARRIAEDRLACGPG